MQIKVIFLNIFIICTALVNNGNADTMKKNQDETATFAGGCFWCIQKDFDHLKGVISTRVGYTGGHKENPTYEEVSSGKTGHAESLEVVYNPSEVTYQALLDFYFRNIDPTRDDGQFCDTGKQYRPIIFYHDEEQKKLAEKMRQKLIDSHKFEAVRVEILPAQTFYPAEEYHQKYAEKNPLRYKFYRTTCGRDRRLKQLWGS